MVNKVMTVSDNRNKSIAVINCCFNWFTDTLTSAQQAQAIKKS